MDSCLRTKRKQDGTKNSRPIASFGRQWRHVSSKDTQALAKVTLYKLVTAVISLDHQHFSCRLFAVLSVFTCHNFLILNSHY